MPIFGLKIYFEKIRCLNEVKLWKYARKFLADNLFINNLFYGLIDLASIFNVANLVEAI